MDSSCAICLSGWRLPIKILDCGHSFCEWCLIRYERPYRFLRYMPCPTCRKDVRAQKPDELVTNWALQQVVEHYTDEDSMTASVDEEASGYDDRLEAITRVSLLDVSATARVEGGSSHQNSVSVQQSMLNRSPMRPLHNVIVIRLDRSVPFTNSFYSERTARTSLNSGSRLESDSDWRPTEYSTSSFDAETSILGMTSEDGDGTNSSQTALISTSTAASYFSVPSLVEEENLQTALDE